MCPYFFIYISIHMPPWGLKFNRKAFIHRDSGDINTDKLNAIYPELTQINYIAAITQGHVMSDSISANQIK